MNDVNRNRARWSWRSCFAMFKYNRKTRKMSNHQKADLQKSASHRESCSQRLLESNDKNVEPSKNVQFESTENSDGIVCSSAVEKNESGDVLDRVSSKSSTSEIEKRCFDVVDRLEAEEETSRTNEKLGSSLALKSTNLDAIVEDSNEESSDSSSAPTNSSVRLCCDREIVQDANELHSRLFDLSKMNHAITQFKENGNLLCEFIKQIEKLKTKSEDIARTSGQMPRDADLLEARYSALLSTIDSLSLLLKIAQIPASRALINRLVFAIEQRTEQLKKLIQLSTSLSACVGQRRDLIDDDFLSFRSALSSYEHLFSIS